MGIDVEFRTLRYFLAVAREESMTEAANVLHVTQPTLSRQIAELERELGCTLFDRTNRATVLTEDGMRLRQRAEEIVSLVDQTERDITDRGGELAGNIRIGAGETQAMSVVAEVFASMRREHPHVTCELFTGNADTVEERLERGLLDFALLLEPVKLEKYEWVRLPVSDRSGVVVASDSEWARLDAVTPEVLARMPLIVSSRTTNRDIDFEAWSGGALRREDLNIVGSHDLIGNATWLIKAGGACATSIDHLFHLNDDSLRFIPLDPPVTIGSYVVWKKYRLRSRTCEEFLRRLRVACEG
ncbi:LysR family transcriptional regulator [uncultured Parolsenella sp.]|uniref:LysR family transcriptional regulator n=1 Tax=uncultured Parolsenella sp. TaxID=2083008 RepID=UPI002657C92D|nr:LysR family transcriptional regulator [uncultured Parolsenella sp.]